MPRKITKTKKTAKQQVVGRVKKGRAPLDAGILGIAKEHVVTSCTASPGIRATAFSPALPVSVAMQPLLAQCPAFRRPLVGARTSFWLGVGFGIFVIGVLGYLAVRLFQAELAEAVVTGLTQSL